MIYNVGDVLTGSSAKCAYTYYLYPAIICFKEGTKVLCLINKIGKQRAGYSNLAGTYMDYNT
jgi:hypothetical protein